MQAEDRQETENAGFSFKRLRSNSALAAIESDQLHELNDIGSRSDDDLETRC